MLREFLYLFIFVGVTHIFVSLNLLHYHEAFLASGVVALLALILIEPAGKRKTSRALILSSLVITLYLLGLKLPLILQEKLNNYLAYFLVGVCKFDGTIQQDEPAALAAFRALRDPCQINVIQRAAKGARHGGGWHAP